MSSSSKPSDLANFCPWDQRVDSLDSASWLRVSYPRILKIFTMCSGTICCCSQPGKGFVPNLTRYPFPILQAKPSPMTRKELITAFQITKASFKVLCGFLIQASKESGSIYFWTTTLFQRLEVFKSRHPHFYASALEDRNIFFNPQPLRALGTTIFSNTRKEKWTNFQNMN